MHGRAKTLPVVPPVGRLVGVADGAALLSLVWLVSLDGATLSIVRLVSLECLEKVEKPSGCVGCEVGRYGWS